MSKQQTEATATIINLETKDPIQCRFRPNEYTFSKSNRWGKVKVMGGNVPVPKFVGGDAITLKMTLFFDTYDDKSADKSDVREYTEKLLDLMHVNSKLTNKRNKKKRPPRCQFVWGKTWSFTAIITQMTQRFTLFNHDGTPVRATVDVTFQQVGQMGIKKQNPTSEGLAQQRTRIVHAGERLDWIAYEEYGDAGQWRFIAETNNLDNPMALELGQRLVIAPLV